MDFGGIPLFNVIKTKMNYTSERQSILAQNIANADTPGYRARDVDAPDFKAIVKASAQNLPSSKLQMAVTSSGHILAQNASQHYKVADRKGTYELNPDGNNVSIDEEMMKVAANQTDYQQSLSLYRKMISMFNTALGRGNSGG